MEMEEIKKIEGYSRLGGNFETIFRVMEDETNEDGQDMTMKPSPFACETSFL